MKRLLFCVGMLLAASTLFAQTVAPPKVQKSPAMKEEASIGGKAIAIVYCSPRVRGREGKIFTKDGLIGHERHYPVWRAGANSATTLTTEADLKIGDLEVPKGSYTLFVDIADPAHWVLIVSKQTGEWGLAYDSAQDLGRVPMETVAAPALVEELKYTLTDESNGKGKLALSWEKVSASVPVEVK